VKLKVLIVEDQFVVANNLQMILQEANYKVLPIARSVNDALKLVSEMLPDIVLVDIQLQGKLTGIDLAHQLNQRNIAFVYVSANSNKPTLNAAKETRPYGFIVKPFKEQDVIVMLDVAWYLHRYHLGKHQNFTALQSPYKSYEKSLPEGIIGTSPKFLEVIKQINIVSQSDTSVLICGESGTGKELIAKAIHTSSRRKDTPMVIVNCAALPANLIESELFGHEKGSFTGANSLRIGKFEQANGGTIFLDEVGELPPDLQIKFLRVLQEMEIERVGGTTKKIDVRVIAATNRNLEDEVANDSFRLDLYYRLNIFPITLPSLRERKEDILPLANFFLAKYSKKENKEIIGLSEDVKQLILDYNFPGNIRELENLMARSVLLATGNIVKSLLLPKNKQRANTVFDRDGVKTMEENERDHILSILEKCDWKVYGQGGAAELLDINVSTLNSRMRKLGIEKPLRNNRK